MCSIYNLSSSRWEHHKGSCLGQSSTIHRLVTSSRTGILGSTDIWEVPKAISPIEAVTMSMYLKLVASSWLILVDVKVVIACPTKRLDGISSWGALMMTWGGWPLVKDWAIFLKPGSGTFGGSSRLGSGIGDLHDEAELEVPSPLLLCSSIQWHWALLLLELQLWWHHLKSPEPEGICPTGVTRWDGCISFQLGNSCARDSFTFLSVSGGVGGAADSLVNAVAGPPEAVARMSGSSADGAVSISGEVVGLLSGTGVCVVPTIPSSVAQYSGVPCLGVVPFKTAPSVKVVKRPHCLPQLMDTSHQKMWFTRLWWVGLFGPILEGLGICLGLMGLSFPIILAGHPRILNWQECLPTDAFWGGWWKIIVVDLEGLTPHPENLKRSFVPSRTVYGGHLYEGWPPTPSHQSGMFTWQPLHSNQIS